jgi:hypothetical protein
MNRLAQLTSALVVLGAASPILFAQAKPRVVVPSNRVLPMAGGTTLSAISASPSTISFAATDPDLGSDAGSSAATISWTTSGGSSGNTWNLSVKATTANFTSCATVPTSAVTAKCTGVTGGSGGACGASVPLSTSAQQVASGKEAGGPGNKPYSVTINFTLADSWSYIANSSCSLSLTYTVNAP